MKNFMEKLLLTGLGAVSLSKEKAEESVNELIERGKLEKGRKDEVIQELVNKGEEAKTKVEEIVDKKVEKVLAQMDIPTKSDIKSLEEKIESLEQRLDKVE